MRILHVINNLGSGGAEKLLTDILPVMKAEGHHVEVVISSSKTSVPKYHDILAAHGVKVTDYLLSYYNPVQIFKLASLVRKGKFDIVHAHLFPTQYWLAFASLLFSREVKMAKTEHSVFNERKGYAILRPLEKFVYSRYHRIIAITDLVKQNLSGWLGSDRKMVVINNGVNLSQIRQNIESANAADYGFFDPANYNVLMVGRFDFSQKDQKSLIEAVALLGQDVHVFFAGKGPNELNLKELAQKLGIAGRVHFLGVRTDVYKIMSLANLNVLSTNHEGLSGVALESLASGTAFIGSDVEGVYDVVPDADFLFPKQDPEALARKIQQLRDQPAFAESLVIKGLEHVKQYDIPLMAHNYLNVYRELHG